MSLTKKLRSIKSHLLYTNHSNATLFCFIFNKRLTKSRKPNTHFRMSDLGRTLDKADKLFLQTGQVSTKHG